MEIILTGDIEKALVSEAKERGTTPEELALESLRREFVHTPMHENSADVQELQGARGARETLADFLSGFIGVLHSSEHVPGGATLRIHRRSIREAAGREATARALVILCAYDID